MATSTSRSAVAKDSTPAVTMNYTSTSAVTMNDASTPAVATNNLSAIVIGISIPLGLLVLMLVLIVLTVLVYFIKKKRMPEPVDKELSEKSEKRYKSLMFMVKLL